jgi:hypothetical protein
MRAKSILALGGLLAAVLAAGCSSVDVVRLQPDQLHLPKGMEPIAGIQTTCLGFYLFTLGLPEADLEKAVNELLMKEAKKIGADKVMDLRFDATPSHGLWWLTKLLGFRMASAWGIAIRAEPGAEEPGPPPPPPPLPLPPPAASQPTGAK